MEGAEHHRPSEEGLVRGKSVPRHLDVAFRPVSSAVLREGAGDLLHPGWMLAPSLAISEPS